MKIVNSTTRSNDNWLINFYQLSDVGGIDDVYGLVSLLPLTGTSIRDIRVEQLADVGEGGYKDNYRSLEEFKKNLSSLRDMQISYCRASGDFNGTQINCEVLPYNENNLKFYCPANENGKTALDTVSRDFLSNLNNIGQIEPNKDEKLLD